MGLASPLMRGGSTARPKSSFPSAGSGHPHWRAGGQVPWLSRLGPGSAVSLSCLQSSGGSRSGKHMVAGRLQMPSLSVPRPTPPSATHTC